MVSSDASKDKPATAEEEVAQLREEVQTLVDERVSPHLASAATAATQYVQQAKEVYADQTKMLSDRVRAAPFIALLISVGAGYLLGRAVR